MNVTVSEFEEQGRAEGERKREKFLQVLFKVIGEIPSLQTTGHGSGFHSAYLCFFFFKFLINYLFIFGCVGSSFLCEGFL